MEGLMAMDSDKGSPRRSAGLAAGWQRLSITCLYSGS